MLEGGGSNHKSTAAFKISLGDLNSHLSEQRADGCDMRVAMQVVALPQQNELRCLQDPLELLPLQFRESHCQAVRPPAWRMKQETQ